MSASYCNLLYHVVFSTAGREPWLQATMRPRVHEYLGGAIKGEGGIPLIVNGTADHVHLLAKFRQNKAIAATVGAIKANSSGWISRTFTGLQEVEWQEGYAAFTVSESHVEKVRQYIATQERHHRKLTFRDEVMQLLRAHNLPFDERYL
jgi:putative transposase